MSGTAPAAASLGIAGFAVFLVAAALSFALLLLLRPWLQRYALAHPNARSSHKEPTPQGGRHRRHRRQLSLPLPAHPFCSPTSAALHYGSCLLRPPLLPSSAHIDDVSPIPVLPRLLLQAIAVVVILLALPNELRVASALPYWLERTLLAIAILWFVNLVNFMDGIDWMTVAEVVPVTAGARVHGRIMLPRRRSEITVAFALCGAIVGFAPFNRPVARLFLGDVGSLAIGLLLAWLLIALRAAAILPRRCCCRSITSLTPPSRCSAASHAASRYGRRTAHISINARLNADRPSCRWSGAYSLQTSRLPSLL